MDTRRVKKEKVYKEGWAQLPEPVLQSIVDRLTLMDSICVSDVCLSWYKVLSKELSGWERPGLPWLLMSGEKDRELRTCISVLNYDSELKMLISQARGRYCWGSYREWLVLVKVLKDPKLDNILLNTKLEISLLNPFTRENIDLPEARNLYNKIFLSGPPNLENSICMRADSLSLELSFWVPGAKSWLDHKVNGPPFEDAVFSNGSFYLLNRDYNIWEIKATDILLAINNLEASALASVCHEITMADVGEERPVVKYLVESCGQILLVCRFYSYCKSWLETIDFNVYSLDFSKMSWKRVHNLDGQILFLGRCCSRSVSSSGIGAGVTNCIIFSNDQPDPLWNEWDSGPIPNIETRPGVDNPGRVDWGGFSLPHNKKSKFCFRGRQDRWGPIWFTAPQWWCCKNLTLE